MAKKKFDESKPQSSRAEIETLANTLESYLAECRVACDLMDKDGVKTLIVSNWDTARTALGHVDKFIRQMIAAAKFGKQDAQIHELLEPYAIGQSVDSEIASDASLASKKQQRKGGAKP